MSSDIKYVVIDKEKSMIVEEAYIGGNGVRDIIHKFLKCRDPDLEAQGYNVWLSEPNEIFHIVAESSYADRVSEECWDEDVRKFPTDRHQWQIVESY